MANLVYVPCFVRRQRDIDNWMTVDSLTRSILINDCYRIDFVGNARCRLRPGNKLVSVGGHRGSIAGVRDHPRITEITRCGVAYLSRH